MQYKHLFNSADMSVRRLSIAMLVFSVSLFGALGASRLWLLPTLMTITLEDAQYSVDDLELLQADIRGDVFALEQERATLSRPIQDPLYNALTEQKRQLPSPVDIVNDITRVGEGLLPDLGATLRIDEVSYHVPVDIVDVRGEVIAPSTKSTTALLQFVDGLEDASFVDGTDGLNFHRTVQEDGMSASPFSLTLFLQSP